MNNLGQLANPYRVEDGKHFRLRDFDPADTGKMRSKQHAAAELQRGVDQLRDWQDKLYSKRFDLCYPTLDPQKYKQLEEARQFLCNGKS
jgi:hypothetical protein